MDGTLCLSITGFSCYFSFARISSALMPSASSFFRTDSASVFFRIFSSFGLRLCFLCFQLDNLLVDSFQRCFLLFQVSFQRLHVGSDRCDFSRECFSCRLLLCNLRCEISSRSFGLILATFCSGHRIQTSFQL